MSPSTDDDGETRLYRAVSQEELDDIISFDGFRPGIGQLETKLFTTSAEDAAFFAREVLYPLDQRPLTIVEVIIPDVFGERLFHFVADGKLTIAVELDQLDAFNAVGRMRIMQSSPIPRD
jgi:hypothetical protein